MTAKELISLESGNQTRYVSDRRVSKVRSAIMKKEPADYETLKK